MPRKVDITVPAEHTQTILSEINQLEGDLISLQVIRNACINPPGDVVSATIATGALNKLQRRLDKHGLGSKSGFSLSTSEPDSLISSDYSGKIDSDSVEASWEEMETIISKDSNISSMLLVLVVTSGVLGAVGVATNAIHIAIAGMLVAPGFMPLMRVSLGLVAGSAAVCKRGLKDVLLAYAVLIATAALTAFVMRLLGSDPLPGKADYYQLTQSLFSYWTTVTSTSVAASAAASLAGAVLIATKRSVFTSGVMIGLALVPSAAIVGMALVTGDVASAGQAAWRWLVDAMLIIGISFIYFTIIKHLRHKRNIAM